MKREYAKLLSVLQAYALIATGVRIICTNHVRVACSMTGMQTPWASGLRQLLTVPMPLRSGGQPGAQWWLRRARPPYATTL